MPESLRFYRITFISFGSALFCVIILNCRVASCIQEKMGGESSAPQPTNDSSGNDFSNNGNNSDNNNSNSSIKNDNYNKPVPGAEGQNDGLHFPQRLVCRLPERNFPLPVLTLKGGHGVASNTTKK
ncbi:uncharacterized protein TEOVI_000753800 [Trypanosoma equiperdum]|uniref:Uncharacterized protein n=1 Tax=Trypanosoma equiperdum TaxID=5694 RepID=A0A1G4HYP7_TRYEQ|nr:hypothetical protein, conserved [Trypanosoma equiperdum]